MENEIMNNVMEEVMENNEDMMIEACSNNGTGKGVAIGLGVAAAGYGAYKLGRKLWNKIKIKRAAKNNIPDDISEDKIDEIPE